MKLLMLKGLPGSGKSTWAKQFVAQNPNWVRVNKDSLREMMGSYRTGKDEDLILRWRDSLILGALRRGKSVVVDDTNFHPKHERRLKEIIDAEANSQDPLFMCDFEVKFFDTSLADCIKNDLDRPNSVGEKVIRKMWREFLAPKAEKPPFDFALPNVIICDLDGTLALHNGRSPYDTAKCGEDRLNDVVYSILHRHHDTARVIFVSGRDCQFRTETELWLRRFGFVDVPVLMRPAGDRRPDDVVKQELYDTYIKGKYNVLFVLDDRNRVVDMWRRNGLTCLQVAEGDF